MSGIKSIFFFFFFFFLYFCFIARASILNAPSGASLLVAQHRPPEDLYKGGVNYEYFSPTIEIIKKYTKPMEVGDGVDFRITKSGQGLMTHTTGDGGVDSYLSSLGFSPSMETIDVGFNRTLSIGSQSGDVAVFGFQELCEGYVAAGEYRAVGRRYPVVVMRGVPRMTLKKHNESR